MVLFTRELHEESGLRALGALDEVGVIVFEFVDQPQLLEVHAFRTENYEGSPEESEGRLIEDQRARTGLVSCLNNKMGIQGGTCKKGAVFAD